MQTYTNLVLQGGGVGAIAYAGFLIKAEEKKLLTLKKIKRIAGVSSGAIGALQLALNYSPTELLTLAQTTDFTQFSTMSSTFYADKVHFENEYLYTFLETLLFNKIGKKDVSFIDLKNSTFPNVCKDLYVIATKIFIEDNQPQAIPMIFSYEHTPHTNVVDAVRASASLPIIFSPVRLKEKSKGEFVIDSTGNIYIDGGLVNNFPIEIFDYEKYIHPDSNSDKKIYNSQTLGLRLESPAHYNPFFTGAPPGTESPIMNPFQYASALLFLLNASSSKTMPATDEANRKRSILIDTLGISSTQFNLTLEQKKALFASGEKAALME